MFNFTIVVFDGTSPTFYQKQRTHKYSVMGHVVK